MQITEFKGKKWAIGLDWETLPGEAPIKQEAKEVATKTNCNFGILLDYDGQYAIGLSAKMPKMPSAALYLSLANQEQRSNSSDTEYADWIFVEDVGDDKYWMAVIKNGLPSPQYDAVYDLTTIKEKFGELIVNDTYIFYSPCGEIATLFDGVKHIESKSLNDLTEGIKTKKKFEKLRGIPNSAIYAGVGIVAVGILFFGSSMFLEGKNLRDKARSFKQMQEQQERQSQEQYQSEVKNYNDIVKKARTDFNNNVLLGLSGNPSNILKSWYQNVSEHETGTHGWDLKKIECYYNRQISTFSGQVSENKFACDYQYKRGGLSTNRMLLQDYPYAKISGNDAVITKNINIDKDSLVIPPLSTLDYLPTVKNWGFDMISQLQLLKIVEIDHEIKSSVDITFISPPKPLTPQEKKEGKKSSLTENISIGIAKGELVISNKNNLELLNELADNVDFKSVGVKKATFTVKDLGEMNWEVVMDYYLKSEGVGVVGASSAELNSSSVPVATPAVDPNLNNPVLKPPRR